MAIVGIDTVIYGVESLTQSTRFFIDFGLLLHRQTDQESVFWIPDGSTVILRLLSDPSIPESSYQGYGVKETIWGVDTQASLQALIENLQRDRQVAIGHDGVARFKSDCGMALGLRVFQRRAVASCPDPVNAPNNIKRLNQPRRWLRRALPKTTNHVVFSVLNYHRSAKFFCERLNFRLTDHQRHVGVYLRADGANEHHNLFLLSSVLPSAKGRAAFHHINFGVEDIDELMIGTNRMQRLGWKSGFLGTGRHRIGSALFSYIKCPAGGEAEYGADTDYVDDSWIAREWEHRFGLASWMTDPQILPGAEPEWDVDFLKDLEPPQGD